MKHNGEDNLVSLREAVLYAPGGATIKFAAGLNGKTIVLDQQITIAQNLTIQGPGAGQLAVSGPGPASELGAWRVFEIGPSVQVTLSGLTIRDGIDTDGGGISDRGTLTLKGCTLLGNLPDDLFDASGNSLVLGIDVRGGGERRTWLASATVRQQGFENFVPHSDQGCHGAQRPLFPGAVPEKA